MKLQRFDEILYKELQDREFAIAYLEDALSESTEEFLIALRKYVQANQGMTKCAEAASINREALYRMLSEKGNPELDSLTAILTACGFKLRVA
ncbi:MAG: putative addiction module antidote protein [Armatimonadetes bacterium]|nr:putative addiction module antidote protein [Armatimonadota bacterium]